VVKMSEASGDTKLESSSEREIPSGWRQQCAQGHRSGLARKCRLNNHGSTYISPDGAKFDSLDSVYASVYGAKGDIWEASPSPSLEEMDDTQLQKHKRQRTDYSSGLKQIPPARELPATASFKCTQCSYSFMTSDNLKRHMKTKHEKKGPIPFKAPQKIVSRWSNIVNTAMDKSIVRQPSVVRTDNKHGEILINESVNRGIVTFLSRLDKGSTVKPLPKPSSNISIKTVKTPTTDPQTILKTSSGITIQLNQYPKPDVKITQTSENKRLSSLSAISIVKSSPATMISPTVSVSKEKFSLKNILNPKIIKITPFNEPKIVTIQQKQALVKSKQLQVKPKPMPETLKPLPERRMPVTEKSKPVTNGINNSIKPENLPPPPRVVILSSREQELAQQEKLFLAIPVKCYFCELGRSRMSKSDPAEFFHLQLEMNGQLGKGNPSNRDVENLASYLRVNIGIARKVLQHIGVGNQTKDSKNRLSFIRRMCWDNMESLRDLCNSFEQVWRSVNMVKDTYNISQEVLGQVDRWKFLFPKDDYYQTFLNEVFIHIHQGQDNSYSFMRNKIVDIEID